MLFTSGSFEIKVNFATILTEFLPRYFKILLQEKYESRIAEIRIEGHTDTVAALMFDEDPYMGNIILSQLRSAQVLKFFRGMNYFYRLSENEKNRLQFWITANGLSYGRTLDDNQQLTVVSGEPINNELSRRVEFRIITTSKELVDDVLKEIDDQ